MVDESTVRISYFLAIVNSIVSSARRIHRFIRRFLPALAANWDAIIIVEVTVMSF